MIPADTMNEEASVILDAFDIIQLSVSFTYRSLINLNYYFQ